VTRGREATAELTITGTLGEGGMGIVRRARQHSLGREVAVKSARSTATNHKLLQEAWTTGRLEHPNIVPVHQLGRDGRGNPQMVMKLIEGVAWGDILRGTQTVPGGGPELEDSLSWNLRVLVQVCHAVEFAHSRGVIHRDLKPDNVMIGAFGEVVLLDWGVAVAMYDDGSGHLPLVSGIRAIAGTPAYMAPEMTTPDPSGISPRTDVFLLGAVLHELITGSPPHRGTSLHDVLEQAHLCEPIQIGESVQPALARTCTRAMRREPAERHPSATALASELEAFLRHRASLQTSQEAARRLTELETLLADDAPPNHSQLYELFGQCRFGFRQALRTHPSNPQATRGLATAIEAMVAHELDRGELGAAAALLEQHPATTPKLEAQREHLRAQLRRKKKDLDALHRLRADLDPDASIDFRVRMIVAIAVFWGLVSVAMGALDKAGVHTPTTGELFLSQCVVLATVLVAIALGRRRLQRTRLNVRLVTGALVTFTTLTAVVGLGQLQDQQVLHVVVQEMLVCFLAVTLMAVAIDRRLTAMAVVYLVTFAWSARLDTWAWEIAGLGDVLAGCAIAYGWRRSARTPTATD